MVPSGAGDDGYGQLGDGSAGDYSATPVQALGGPYQQVDARFYSTCAVTATGEGRCWGLNASRQLGHSTPTYYSATPGPVDGGHTFSQIQVGLFAGCGLRTDGQTLCWGNSRFGTLGQGTTVGSSGPVVVTGGHTYQQTDVGVGHVCGILSDGTAHCWGHNRNGQLGIGSTIFSTGTPTAVAGTDKWAFLSTSWYSMCGVTTTGTGKCWGWNYYGQAGTGSSGANLLSPTEVTGGLTFGN